MCGDRSVDVSPSVSSCNEIQIDGHFHETDVWNLPSWDDGASAASELVPRQGLAARPFIGPSLGWGEMGNGPLDDASA
jgi:hypothetical protein